MCLVTLVVAGSRGSVTLVTLKTAKHFPVAFTHPIHYIYNNNNQFNIFNVTNVTPFVNLGTIDFLRLHYIVTKT